MSTFERDPVIASLASRALDQVKAGLNELHAGNYLAAEVFLNAACATLSSLSALLDGTAPAKPMPKLRVVAVDVPGFDTLPAWMEKRHGEPDDGAA